MPFRRLVTILLPLLAALTAIPSPAASMPDDALLKTYVEAFNARDEELYPQSIPNREAFDFLRANIPLFDAPDPDFVRTYYFRWWSFRKHIRATDSGRLITEFLPDVPWAGKDNMISCPAGHHLYEARWLRSHDIARDNAVFWLTKTEGKHLRHYSNWLGMGLWALQEVDPDPAFLTRLLPAMTANYEGWEKTHLRPDGLFYQTDDADGMEVSISGSGRRPTLNTYLYGEACVIARSARLAGQAELATAYEAKAARLRSLILEKMWDEDAGFFKALPGETEERRADVRELLGYTPWFAAGLVPGEEKYARAWKQLMDPQGFLAPFGPTTAERRHPRFTVSTEGHECQWNGPSWPFATSLTLQAMAGQLHAGGPFPLSRADYFKVLETYTRSHRLRQDQGEGKDQPWIDENLDPFTGVWLARKLLLERHQAPRERGKDYNHSCYADLIISGLAGLQPREDGTVRVDPLLPEGQWPWFCLDRIRYHGHDLTILWDQEGSRYERGKGLTILVDGKAAATRPDLGVLEFQLPKS